MSECTFINVDNSKLNQMIESTWIEYETPVVATPIEYKLKIKDSFSSGFIMITRGANYIFKKKLSSVELVNKFHTLDIRQVRLSISSVDFEFDDEQINVKSKDSVQIFCGILRILNEASYGIKNLKTFQLFSDISIPNCTISQRPQQALKWRALFFAHFYNIKGEQLKTMTYFDKWETHQNPMLVLGPSLHPGNFCAAFGHAIGWESKINTLVFQSHAPTSFNRLLQSILTTTQTIHRIAFSDYSGDRPINFQITSILNTPVSSWIFTRTISSLFLDWASSAKNLPKGSIRQIQISLNKDNVWTANDFTKYVDIVASTPSLQECREFIIDQIHIDRFPLDQLNRLSLISPGLQNITMKNIENIDGTDILTALQNTNLQEIVLGKIKFDKVIPHTTKLPPSLVLLNVSECSFSQDSFISFLGLLIRDPFQIPLTLRCRYLNVDPAVYGALSTVNFSACQPGNLVEVDWSGNKFPSEISRHFFSYLFTQKQLKMLVLNDIGAENPMELMQFVLKLITNLKLTGIEFWGLFPPNIVVQFVNAIMQQAPFIKRFGLVSSQGSDEIAKTIVQMIQNSAMTDCLVDNMEIKTVVQMQELLNALLQSKSIVGCHLPQNDVKRLKGKKGLKELRIVYDSLKNGKKKPSTFEKRVAYVEEMIKIGKTPAEIFSDDYFEKCDNAEIVVNDDLYLSFTETGAADKK